MPSIERPSAGFGLCELELESPYRELQLRARHRRNLVEKAAAMGCQIREHLHLSLPGFSYAVRSPVRPQVGHGHCPSLCFSGRGSRAGTARASANTCARTWSAASNARSTKYWPGHRKSAGDTVQDGALHHAIWTDLEELYQRFQRRIRLHERELAGDLVQTPYIRLLAIPGINVVSAAELAGEMGPITRYANANAITGRCGLYPSRYQSDQTDNDRGPIIRQANRRIRCALMRIADNLVCHCAYYRGLADVDRARKVDERAIRVKIAKKFSRLAFASVAGDEPMKHPAMRQPNSIMEKLREFHRVHETPMNQVLADLKASVEQLPYHTRNREAEVVAEVLRQNAARRRGSVAVGMLLPAVLARLEIKTSEETETRGRS